MVLKLYSQLGSPAARGSLLTIAAIGIKNVEIINVSLVKKDNVTPEYLQKNPLHTVPTLEDGGFVLWDSHAINGYLVDKYGENDLLYPKDPQKRALVDAMNHFDTGYLFGRAASIMRAYFLQDKNANIPEMKNQVLESYDFLEKILSKRSYVAGDQMTIADLSIVATLSTSEIDVPLSTINHSKILEWYKKMQSLPYYEKINQRGVDIIAKYLKTVKLSSKI